MRFLTKSILEMLKVLTPNVKNEIRANRALTPQNTSGSLPAKTFPYGKRTNCLGNFIVRHQIVHWRYDDNRLHSWVDVSVTKAERQVGCGDLRAQWGVHCNR